jgi:hypothetical protein
VAPLTKKPNYTHTTTTTLHKTLLVNNGTYNQLIHKQCTTPVNRASVDVRRRQQYIARHLNKRICTHLKPQSNFATVVQSSNPRIHGDILRERKINKPGNASGGEAYKSECRENESTPCREGVPATAGAKHTNKDGGARALGLRTNDFVRPIDEVRPSVQPAPTFV